ncbi:MAG: bifunctional riboflavin kinase/FAD synthetase [Bacteroidales bacterium]|jgi:riboflavin kinase/FMN adenylyltransferase
MKFYHDISCFPKIKNAIVTVGNFDGVHLGHKAILKKMQQIKKETNGNIVVITFHPHPKEVLTNKPQNYITSKGRKTNLLARQGVDYLLEIHFTKEFAKTSTEDFIINYLINTINAIHIVVGYDCHFGHNYNDTISILQKLSKTYNFKLTQIPPVYINKNIVSSTIIRKFLEKGMIENANEMLGYSYSVFGQVTYGKQLGRTIGFPTANIFLENKLKIIAANGVYACIVRFYGVNYYGMCNIGTRPTVNGKDLSIEVNIFDFDKEIYGKNISIYFKARIRDEIKFNNLEELKIQLTKDKQAVINLLNKKS